MYGVKLRHRFLISYWRYSSAFFVDSRENHIWSEEKSRRRAWIVSSDWKTPERETQCWGGRRIEKIEELFVQSIHVDKIKVKTTWSRICVLNHEKQTIKKHARRASLLIPVSRDAYQKAVRSRENLITYVRSSSSSWWVFGGGISDFLLITRRESEKEIESVSQD